MRKIDMHHHLVEETGYVDGLLRAMDAHEIERTALIGLGPLFPGLFRQGKADGSVADNDAVERAVRTHPDRFFGLGFLRLGDDGPERVTELIERGFRGLKFHVPRKPYDDERFFPVYAAAQRQGLPCLFHTGILSLPVPRPAAGIRSDYMNCLRVEPIAQAFPELPIVIAHLGVQDVLTALTLVRIFPNILADLSGSVPGWRANYGPDDWRRLLWFPHAPEKLLFGSDVHYAELPAAIEINSAIAAAAGWDTPARQRFYHTNAATLFGLQS